MTYGLPAHTSFDHSSITHQQQAVRQVVETMRQNFWNPMSLNDMAEMANFSPCYFNQVFRSIVGIPPSRYLTALRIDAAKRLLIDTTLRVIDICYEVGYNSLGTFSSRFTELVGISPQGFRELADQDNWRLFQAFLQAQQRALPSIFHSHKQIAMGSIYAPQAAQTPVAIKTQRPATPTLIGLYPLPMPQGKPIAYTIAPASRLYMLPPVADGRYYVFATAFEWSQDPRSFLLLDWQREDLLVGMGDRPLWVRNGRYQNHIDLHLRPMQPTDPPLLSALFYFMVLAQQQLELFVQRS